jgi:magnesium chelatase family protein
MRRFGARPNPVRHSVVPALKPSKPQPPEELKRCHLPSIHSRALDGLKAAPVSVEVHLANGLPDFTQVGLAETEVKESREHVRAALLNSGLSFPHNKRITVTLAPADLPKEGRRFGIPIALGILAASGQLDMAQQNKLECAGELSLAGELRPVSSATEAALVPGVAVRQAAHLLEMVAALAPAVMPDLLPPLSEDEALESAAVLSLAGQFDASRWGQRVMRTPHQTASSVALVGGGSPPRSGEISPAQHGMLFLDVLPEYPRPALEALREPLETGRGQIASAARSTEFPARFQLIAAMSPCPCGQLGNPLRECRCAADQVARYQGRSSGQPHHQQRTHG